MWCVIVLMRWGLCWKMVCKGLFGVVSNCVIVGCEFLYLVIVCVIIIFLLVVFLVIIFILI